MPTLNLLHATGYSGFADDINRYYRRLHRLSKRSRNVIPRPIRTDIQQFLAEANHGRLMRLLDSRDVQFDIARVIEAKGHVAVRHTHGGHVANAYNYRAYATSSLVLRVGRIVGIKVIQCNARKGCTGFGRIAAYLGHTQHSQELRTKFIQDEADILLELY